MLTLNSVEGQRQKLGLFLLSVSFCLHARGKMVIPIDYKRGTTFSLEGDPDLILESSFFLLVFFFLTIVTHTAQGAALYLGSTHNKRLG